MFDIYYHYIHNQLGKIGLDVRSEKGASAIEYIIIALVLALAIFGIFTLLGGRIGAAANRVGNCLTGDGPCS